MCATTFEPSLVINASKQKGENAGALYSDSGCSAKLPVDPDINVDVGKCIQIDVGEYQKLTCDPASSLSVAFLAVFASVLAMFVF
jgi:hypothetical protein